MDDDLAVDWRQRALDLLDRAGNLRRELANKERKVATLRRQLAIATVALRWYANDTHWPSTYTIAGNDDGDKAREALAAIEKATE